MIARDIGQLRCRLRKNLERIPIAEQPEEVVAICLWIGWSSRHSDAGACHARHRIGTGCGTLRQRCVGISQFVSATTRARPPSYLAPKNRVPWSPLKWPGSRLNLCLASNLIDYAASRLCTQKALYQDTTLLFKTWTSPDATAVRLRTSSKRAVRQETPHSPASRDRALYCLGFSVP
jgi:hypothetical protein